MVEDGSSFKVVLPGWAIDDVNIISRNLTQPNYVRMFRVLSKWEMLREIGKAQGFLDICEFEKTHATYMKCVDVERKISNEELIALGRNPYEYDLCLESKIGRIGKSSFQIDNHVFHGEGGTELFRGSLVYVTVDYETLRPVPTPSAWIQKYTEASKSATFPALKVNIRQAKGKETILHRSSFVVRPSEVDRFGHTNNQCLNSMCADAVLDTFSRGCVPAIPSVEYLESCPRCIEVDFVGSSEAGDSITATVFSDSAQPNKLFCKLFKGPELIYVMSQEYDIEIINSRASSML